MDLTALISGVSRLGIRSRFLTQNGTRPIYPPLADGMCIYAIGDIHGRADLLPETFAKIDADRLERSKELKRCFEIYIGDLIDRGSRSADVIDMLIERRKKRACTFIRGNHESVLIDILNSKDASSKVASWFNMGGAATAFSYGVEDIPRHKHEISPAFVERLRAAIPEDHKRFLEATRDFLEADNYVFVHAGLRPGVPLECQSTSDMHWIRSQFLTSTISDGVIVVHGHTPCEIPEFKANRINIDTGAYATGKLTCVRIDDRGPSILAELPT